MSTSKILISSLFLRPRRVGGAETFLYNLLKGFKKNDLKNIDILLDQKQEYEQKNFQGYNLTYQNVKYNRAFNEMFLSNLDMYDAALMTNYVSPMKKFRNVSTIIHDLQYKHYPEFFSCKKRAWLHFSHMNTLKKANKVIVISDFVRNDILQVFGRKFDSKIIKVYNPIDVGRFSKTEGIFFKKNFKINKKYILSVAAHYPHKNIKTLILAFNEFSKHNDEYELILVGQLPTNLVGSNKASTAMQLQNLVSKNKNVKLTGYVNDSELGQLYKNADFFVFPSIFEGFGMPPVEAMMMGLPVITTRHPAIYETTMGLAHYIDNPLDKYELSEKITKLVNNLPLERKISEKNSFIVSQRYDPAIIAEQYHRVMTNNM